MMMILKNANILKKCSFSANWSDGHNSSRAAVTQDLRPGRLSCTQQLHTVMQPQRKCKYFVSNLWLSWWA